MSTIYMMCGLPGSGKSTYAKKLNKPIVSTDEIRLELLGDYNDQSANSTIFDEAFRRIKNYVSNNQDVVFDATNLQAHRRKSFIKRFKKTPIVCIVVDTDPKICFERNRGRSEKKKVPENKMKQMARNFQFPNLLEGYSKIIIETLD